MRDITLCHPRLQLLAVQLVEESGKQGLMIKIGETLRTVAEQDALYAQGRTKPGSIVTNAPGSSYSSYHQWGTAFDIFRNDGAGPYNDSGNFFTRVGAIGAALGLEWGGNWKSIVDKPHFQLPDWGSSTSGIKKIYANPEAFMKTWTTEKRIGWIKDNQTAGGTAGQDGTYPANAWVCHNHHWYLFNRDGYAWHRLAPLEWQRMRPGGRLRRLVLFRPDTGWAGGGRLLGIAGTTGHRGYGTWMPWIVFKKKRGALRD